MGETKLCTSDVTYWSLLNGWPTVCWLIVNEIHLRGSSHAYLTFIVYTGREGVHLVHKLLKNTTVYYVIQGVNSRGLTLAIPIQNVALGASFFWYTELLPAQTQSIVFLVMLLC